MNNKILQIRQNAFNAGYSFAPIKNIIWRNDNYVLVKAIFNDNVYDGFMFYDNGNMYFDMRDFTGNFATDDFLEEKELINGSVINLAFRIDKMEELFNNILVITKNKLAQKTYLMKDGSGYTKIGKSSNPKHREKTLQSEKPSIVLLAICNNNIESELHDAYNSFRIRGEWFNISDKQISDIIKDYGFKIVI